MKPFLLLICLIALALVIGPPCLAVDPKTGLSQPMKTLMLVGTVLWFAGATPLAGLRQTPPRHSRTPTNPH